MRGGAAWSSCPHICGSEPIPHLWFGSYGSVSELCPIQALAGRPHSVQALQFGAQELAFFQEAETTLTPLPIAAGRCILPAGAEKRLIDLNRTDDQLPSHPRPNFPELRVHRELTRHRKTCF